MAIRIAMIGAGSIGFTRRLVRDVLATPELAETVFAFCDISEENLNRVAALCRRDIAHANLPAKIETTTLQRDAIRDADYVICTIRQGGLEAFESDVEIPLKYGVDQCVGDTLCAGGLMYAQRTIPALLSICRDMREVARPDAMLLNYSNPMAMNTWACIKYGGVPTIGLCHGVQHAHWQIAHVIEIAAKREGLLPRDYVSPGHVGKQRWGISEFPIGLHRREVDVIAAGINHQTWFTQVRFRGHDWTRRLPEIFPQHPEFARTEKVRLDVLQRFGFYSTESNGHLSEYLPWYRKRTNEIERWIDRSSWIHGETGGYLRYCREGRHTFDAEFEQWLAEPPMPIGREHRSEEHGGYIIESLQTGRAYRGHFNVINRGHISNLPDGCCIEIPGYVDGNGISMPVVGALPLACAATCSASVRVQEMGMEAAVRGDVMLLKRAMLHDPLVGAVCNPEEVWQLADEMLVAQQQWLPNYKQSDITAAANRLQQHNRAGTRVTNRDKVPAVG